MKIRISGKSRELATLYGEKVNDNHFFKFDVTNSNVLIFLTQCLSFSFY